MRPDELSTLLTSLSAAADVVEAIECPAVQRRRGWNLTHWTYNLIPWGVRFLYRNGQQENEASVIALALPEGVLAPRDITTYCRTTCRPRD